MPIIELGSYAGALIAVVTLIQKLVKLIAAIQKLILRLDTMQTEIEAGRKERVMLQTDLMNCGMRLTKIEEIVQTI